MILELLNDLNLQGLEYLCQKIMSIAQSECNEVTIKIIAIFSLKLKTQLNLLTSRVLIQTRRFSRSKKGRW